MSSNNGLSFYILAFDSALIRSVLPVTLFRPTMIMYGIDNIRDLFGHKVITSLHRRLHACKFAFAYLLQ